MIFNAINVHDAKLFIDFKFFQRGSQKGEGQGEVVPPNSRNPKFSRGNMPPDTP